VPPLCPTHLPDAQGYVSFLKGIYSSFYGMHIFFTIMAAADMSVYSGSILSPFSLL
jgi:hypothetical protein